jgi:hypothetical protein
LFQVPALKRDLEQARINQACEIGWLCYESLFRWHWDINSCLPYCETPFVSLNMAQVRKNAGDLRR